MSSHLAHFQILLILSISVSALAPDLDSIGLPEDDGFLFSDTGSAASLDQGASFMFDFTQLPSSSDFSPFDSSAFDNFLEEDIGSNDINIQSPTRENDDDMFSMSLISSEPAHADEESYQEDATPEPLIAAVDDATFSPSDEDADAGGDGGEIADLSGSEERLLRSPFGALNRYGDQGRGKINPYCSLYTQTYNPVGVCAPNTKGDQVELPRPPMGFSSPTPFSGYRFWDVNHATYGTLIQSNWELILILVFSPPLYSFSDLHQILD